MIEVSWVCLEKKINLSVVQMVECNCSKARRAFFAYGGIGWFQGDLSSLSGRLIIDTCVLPVLLYDCEQWHLTETSLVRLDCLVGELCKRVLKLPKWFCNTPARIVMGLPSMRAHCMPGDETMLVILHKLTNVVAESASLLGARILGALGSEQESIRLVRECVELEEWYGTSFTEALCSNDADHPGAREIREAIHGSEKGKLLDECECRSDAVVVVRVERETGWCRLWDCGRDRGPKCIAGLRAFIRIIIAHANNCCPKCDVSRLEEGTTLLAHVIDMHVSAGFSAVHGPLEFIVYG